jgi:DNA-binding GntR family transcriptional regulator
VAIPLLQPSEEFATSQSDRAYFAIRAMIVRAQLPPGSLLSEAELMETLGLGRTPIREALRTLANENLVDVYPRRGMFVAGIDTRDLAAISEVRSELESFAARLAAQRSNPGDRAITAQLLGELEELGETPDPHALLNIDQRMHHHVYKCAHNAYLERTLDQYFVHSLRIWALALHKMRDLQLAVLEHRNLLTAIHEGDADKAAELMFHLVAGFETEIRKTL